MTTKIWMVARMEKTGENARSALSSMQFSDALLLQRRTMLIRFWRHYKRNGFAQNVWEDWEQTINTTPCPKDILVPSMNIKDVFVSVDTKVLLRRMPQGFQSPGVPKRHHYQLRWAGNNRVPHRDCSYQIWRQETACLDEVWLLGQSLHAPCVWSKGCGDHGW